MLLSKAPYRTNPQPCICYKKYEANCICYINKHMYKMNGTAIQNKIHSMLYNFFLSSGQSGTFLALGFFSQASDRGFLLVGDVALANSSANSLVFIICGSSRELHSISLLRKEMMRDFIFFKYFAFTTVSAQSKAYRD